VEIGATCLPTKAGLWQKAFELKVQKNNIAFSCGVQYKSFMALNGQDHSEKYRKQDIVN